MTKEKEGLNQHHLVGFIETTCNIQVGDQFLWKYNCDHTYRHHEVPSKPTPATHQAQKHARADESRCKGCKCVNPCSSLKYCLTPQNMPSKRVSGKAANMQ
jgi:hypothetical protein